VEGGGQEARNGCEFASFFKCADGATPGDLLKRGIYSEIAVPLKGGPWREASMVLLSKALAMSKKQAQAAAEGSDVLKLRSEHGSSKDMVAVGMSPTHRSLRQKGVSPVSSPHSSPSLESPPQRLKRFRLGTEARSPLWQQMDLPHTPCAAVESASDEVAEDASVEVGVGASSPHERSGASGSAEAPCLSDAPGHCAQEPDTVNMITEGLPAQAIKHEADTMGGDASRLDGEDGEGTDIGEVSLVI
jgi:hypothetical protein